MTLPATHIADDPYRLPRHVTPTRYELRLEPDLDNKTFAGHVTITVIVHEPTSEILLNVADLEVTSAAMTDVRGITEKGAIHLQQERQRCCIRFATTCEAGTWQLILSFNGTLNDKLRGFYRSTYKDSTGVNHVLAATQFEATDARRAFPCWDEPNFKAIFAITMVIDPNLTAVSNTAVQSEDSHAGKKVLRFADTIKMSTYLVAFVVGNLEATDPVMVGPTPLRLWTVPGKRHLASFGQDIARFSLSFLSNYYGIPYPGDKLDLIAIPDFASGAMENLGAITFRESALLLDRGRATRAELERVADVVSHENAHMWFGDLVTMSWWNGLWLNEAFATFMEILVVDVWKPEWERWTAFGVSRAAALSVDGLHSTRPIEYPVHAPKDAEAMFDVLTYEKGAAVLRMLEQYIGPAVFRQGVRDYLHHHAYANADTKDLWLSLGRAARQDIDGLLNAWVFAPGYPLLTASLNGPSDLVISQQRFTYLPKPIGDDGQAHDADQQWNIPIHINISTGHRTESRTLLLTQRETSLSLPNDWTSVLLNEGGHGFYRVHYAPVLMDRLLKSGVQRFGPIDRFNFVNDAWASTLALMMSPADYLSLTSHFTMERDHNVWAALLNSFSTLHHILESSDRPLFEHFMRNRLREVVDTLGWSPRPDESDLIKQLRGDLIRALGTLGNAEETQQRAIHDYDLERATPGLVDPNVLSALISISAFTGDEARYNEFVERFHSAATPQEERHYLYALAAFKARPLLRRTLEKTMTNEIRTQDAPFLLLALLNNVYGREDAWQFIKQNWDYLDRTFPKNGLRRMCGGIVALTTPELEQDVRAFFTSRNIDLGGQTLAQYLERLHLLVTFRERTLPVIRTALGKEKRFPHHAD